VECNSQPGALPERAVDECLAATEALKEPEAGQGRDRVDGAEDDLGDVRVGNAYAGEETRSVLEKCVRRIPGQRQVRAQPGTAGQGRT